MTEMMQNIPADAHRVHKITDTGTLGILLIKPSHYDDDGYVIRWWRSFIPSHTLSVFWGILDDAAEREVLGPNVKFKVACVDETSEKVDPKKRIKDFAGCDRIIVMLCAVQTSQFTRAVDLTREFKMLGCDVAIGGFHVSGTMALTPTWPLGRLETTQDEGITLFAGELENGIDTLLQDAWQGTLKSMYDYSGDLPDISNAPMPKVLPLKQHRTVKPIHGVDTSRGCPFKCSFCSIINVAGNTMRARGHEAIEQYLNDCADAGMRRFYFADDNFTRLKSWSAVLDIFIKVQEEKNVTFDLYMQIDTRANKLPGFVEKSARAGVRQVFIGIESVRDEGLKAVGKKHNKVKDLHDMVMDWHKAGILVMGLFICGFENDTPETLQEDIQFLQKEAPIDFLVLFMMTAMPGSKDHQRVVEEGIELDADLNNYDGAHAVMPHPKMSAAQWKDAYWKMNDTFYSPRHFQTILEHGLEHKLPLSELIPGVFSFYIIVRFERMHPFFGGILRRKSRDERRPHLSKEPFFKFHRQRLWKLFKTQSRIAGFYLYIFWLLARAKIAVTRRKLKIAQ
jgi:radical SAM superfamily enzyme YgiQ (UPF0313 family)